MKKVIFSLALLVSSVVVCNTVDVDVTAENAQITITEQTQTTAVLSPEELANLSPEQLAAYHAAQAKPSNHVHVTVVTKDVTTRSEDALAEEVVKSEEAVTRSVETSTESVVEEAAADEATLS